MWNVNIGVASSSCLQIRIRLVAKQNLSTYT